MPRSMPSVNVLVNLAQPCYSLPLKSKRSRDRSGKVNHSQNTSSPAQVGGRAVEPIDCLQLFHLPLCDRRLPAAGARGRAQSAAPRTVHTNPPHTALHRYLKLAWHCILFGIGDSVGLHLSGEKGPVRLLEELNGIRPGCFGLRRGEMLARRVLVTQSPAQCGRLISSTKGIPTTTRWNCSQSLNESSGSGIRLSLR